MSRSGQHPYLSFSKASTPQQAPIVSSAAFLHPHTNNFKVPLPPFKETSVISPSLKDIPHPIRLHPDYTLRTTTAPSLNPQLTLLPPRPPRPQHHRTSPSTSAPTTRNMPPTASAFHIRTTVSGLKVISDLNPIDTVASHDSRVEGRWNQRCELTSRWRWGDRIRDGCRRRSGLFMVYSKTRRYGGGCRGWRDSVIALSRRVERGLLKLRPQK